MMRPDRAALPVLLALVALAGATGCAGGASRQSPVSVLYTVDRIPGNDADPSLYQVEVRFESDGNVVSSPSVTVREGEWATISVASFKPDEEGEGLWEMTDEGPRIADTSAVESGTFVAVRCTPAESPGLVHTEMRTYFVEEDRAASKELAEDVDPKETHGFEWKW